MQNIVGKKRAHQADVESDCLFDSHVRATGAATLCQAQMQVTVLFAAAPRLLFIGLRLVHQKRICPTNPLEVRRSSGLWQLFRLTYNDTRIPGANSTFG